jgi:hypothetical protein
MAPASVRIDCSGNRGAEVMSTSNSRPRYAACATIASCQHTHCISRHRCPSAFCPPAGQNSEGLRVGASCISSSRYAMAVDYGPAAKALRLQPRACLHKQRTERHASLMLTDLRYNAAEMYHDIHTACRHQIGQSPAVHMTWLADVALCCSHLQCYATAQHTSRPTHWGAHPAT